jgi:DNA-binding GntR family transcriptional regulator
LVSKLQLTGLAGVPRTTHATVTERLREAILSGQLSAGTRLVQAELAQVLNVSVTPIREALRELSTQGLVDMDAFRGAVVHTPTLTELEDIYEMRAVLIPLSIKRGIVRITDQELDQAEMLLSQMEVETEQPKWVELNSRFHNLLDDAIHGSKLRDVLQRLSDLSAIYVNLSFAKAPLQKEASEQEHRNILEAYRQRNVDRATTLVLEHINGTLEAAKKAIS